MTLGPADWLHFAAAPIFALMALLSGIAGGGSSEMLCPASHGMSRLGGMAVMYLLMVAFHSAPWLKLIDDRRRKGAAGPTSGQTRALP